MDCKISPFQEEMLDLIKKTYLTHELLNSYYLQFWKNIYFNDAYILYKEAITFYKNNQNGNFHGGFGFILNEYLFKGSCQYVENRRKKHFNSNSNIKTTSEDLCRLAINVVNILDQVYEIVPKTPIPIIAYRVEQRPPNDDILKMKKGDIYKNLTYLMTSIYPLHTFDGSHYTGENKDIKINFILLIPTGSKTYYLHNPFFFLWDNEVFNKSMVGDKIVAHQENELVIARGGFWKILDKTKIDDANIVYIMQLIAQPVNEKLESNKHKLPKVIYTDKEFKKLGVEYNDSSLLGKFKGEIETKMKLIKLNQKYAKIEKKYDGKENNLVWDIQQEIDNNYKSKMLLSIINKKYPNFYKEFPKIELKKGKIIQSYIVPSLPHYWNFVDKKYDIDGAIFIYQTEYDKNVRGVREEYYYQEFTGKEIYRTDGKISNKTQITKHLFEHCDDLPLFFIVNLKLGRNFEAYDIYPYKKISDPFKDYLLIGKYRLDIDKLDKVYLSDKRYYICMSGSINFSNKI